MDFPDEDLEGFKSHYYLDDDTHQNILEIIERARTAANKHRARRLLDWADSLTFNAIIAEIEMVG